MLDMLVLLVKTCPARLASPTMEYLKNANEAQLAAITHESGPQLIVAGAGTGKTKVITSRIAWLIENKNLKADEILALTFTEKAASEMDERLDQLLPYGVFDRWIFTFHAFSDKILKRHALDIGLPNNYKMLNQTQAWLLVRKNLDKFNLNYYRPTGNPSKFIHALLTHFSRCKDEGITPAEYLEYAEKIKLDTDSCAFIKNIDLEDCDEGEKKKIIRLEIERIGEIANAFHVYQQLLKDNDCLDFADLINYTIQLFKERPLILAKYRAQFKYILVDEFQDTNFVQYELIKLLCAPKNNLTVVGDDDQSIYKFRGASISNIMQFKEDFPDAKNVVLTENYRSCQEILDLAHNFIAQNDPNRLEPKLGINKTLHANRTDKAEIAHLHLATGELEAEAVVRKIVELREKDNSDWSHFAILTRANDSANIFIDKLELAKIPYQFLALRGLYNKPVIVDAINYFKLLDNYHESAAVFRILNLPMLDLQPTQIIKLTHYAKKKTVSLFEAVRKASAVPGIREETIKTLNHILSLVEKDFVAAKTKRPSEILKNFIHGFEYLQFLSSKGDSFAQENIGYLNQFLKKMISFEGESADCRIKDFLELVKMEQEAGDEGALMPDASVGPDMVRIMTVHGSKGLEFDYVFLPHLVDRKFPTDERREPIEIPDALVKEKLPEGEFHLEEERRLFYVAMTRAKKGLFFTTADDYGGARKKKLSKFLTELGYVKPELEFEKVKPTVAPAVGETNANANYELPKRFSFSQMQSYERCPLQYKFSNILKIPTFGNAHFTFGTVIHSTLQKFLEQFLKPSAPQQSLFGTVEAVQPKPELTKLIQLYEECWQDDWFSDENQKQEYYKKGKELLKTFYADFMENQPVVKFLETPFNFQLGNYTFNGRIDRIDEKDGLCEIIDYKTGREKGNDLSTEDKRQLVFYQIAAEKNLNLKLQTLTYYYLETGKKVSFIGKEKDKDNLKLKFLEIIKRIEARDFSPNPNPNICQFCDFKDICEFK